MHRNRRRTGAILLEVMVGTLLLAVVGVAWITLMGQTMQSVRDIRERETEYAAASDDLQHVALWTPGQLDAATGSSRVGSYVLIVRPVAAEVFDVVVADSSGRPLIATSMYVSDHGDSTVH